MDAIADPLIDVVTCMKSAQVGWTEILLNALGFYIDQDPSPLLMVQPTLDMAQAISKDRFAPMIRDTPQLIGKVADNKSRSSGNTILHKQFPGGHVTLSGANSPASLASRPVRVVLCDEVDRFPISAGNEGDPISLARKRSTTFWNKKLLIGSTPTLKNFSKVEAWFNASDKRFFMVPCPDCGGYQRLVWANVHWPEGKPDEAEYMCEHCGVLWDDGERWKAINKGRWEATAAFQGNAGFHIWEGYSTFVRLGEIAENFLEAKKLPETLQTWVNTSLGETWEERGTGVDQESLKMRAGPRVTDDPIPDEVLVITVGADVQDDRIELEFQGWGRDQECWSLDYVVLEGDPSTPELWRNLDDQLLREFGTASGMTMRVAASCIDSGGHYTQQVYNFVRDKRNRRVRAIIGRAGEGRPVISRPSKNNVGKVDLYTVGVDTTKEILFKRLAILEEGPGYCHFPADYPDEYFAQLVSEVMITRYHKGRPKREFKPIRNRNEALDCRVYGMAAYVSLNANMKRVARRHDVRLEKIRQAAQDAAATQEGDDGDDQPSDPTPRSKRRKRRKIMIRGRSNRR